MSALGKLEANLAAPSVPAPAPKTLLEAARQFESLLIAQMLKGARGDDQGGWMGSGEDPESATVAELAEEQFAQALAHSGGLGLSEQIVSSLSPSNSPSGSPPAPSQAPGLRRISHTGVRR